MKNKIIIIGIIIFLAIGAVWYGFSRMPSETQNSGEDKTITYSCDAGQTVTATFHLPSDKDVSLALSDGRTVTVPHALSGSGARYANADESFVFWNKGNTAFITEGLGGVATTTFANCTENTSNASTTTAVYKNDAYGFQIEYPKGLMPTSVFGSSYVLRDQWRSEAGENSTGTPIISIPTFRIDQGGVATGKPYPLKFDAEVHVGVSANPADVANCLKPDPNYTGQKSVDVSINGVIFKKFSFQDAAMMTYLQGESYRTVHNGMCYAVEQVKTGSSYKDPTMTAGIPDATLQGYYDAAGVIVQTFQFTK